jgi:hypothetical protein
VGKGRNINQKNIKNMAVKKKVKKVVKKVAKKKGKKK